MLNIKLQLIPIMYLWYWKAIRSCPWWKRASIKNIVTEVYHYENLKEKKYV